MIVTFSKKNAAANCEAAVVCLVDVVSVKKYRLTWESDSPIGNLVASITWAKGRRVRFTIETRDAWKRGSRMAASGRHMRKASWEAHYDVMAAIFKHDPEATIRTAFATYSGKADFERKAPGTADHNVGSMCEPRTIAQCTVE